MKVELQIPINRVEGDLDIKVTIEDGIITDAKSIGTLYRGFENILKGRDPLDSLVITPRVCGICSISHLTAAVKALEDAYDITPPPQAIRLRNISIISENLQSDLRQVFLMFMSDFTNEYYKNKSFFEKATKLYAPFKGETSKEVLDITKDIVKIIAYIGGQWPHTSHMVPGGLNILSDDLEILRIKFIVKKIRDWYEKNILKTSLESFPTSMDSFFEFIDKNPTSHISIFTNIAKELNLFEIGKTGYGFINFGAIDKDDSFIVPRGYYDTKLNPLNLDKITEDVTYSHYEGENKNPFDEETIVNIAKGYSFAKAPRYDNKVAQTGPLGEELAINNPLFVELYEKYEDSVFVRELARFLRPIRFIQILEEEIEKVIKNISQPLYIKPKKKKNAHGIGLTHAARGALGHWIKIKDGKISNYQIISPTTWNGSPRDDNNLGPWEKALIGLEIKDIDNPMEMGHVIRSFDPCLVCTVHFIGEDKRISLKV